MSDWYYAVNNEQKGPINESELKAHFATNKLSDDTLVWKDGMDGWAPANQVPAFSFRQPPIPAKVQPPGLGGTPVTAGNPIAARPAEESGVIGTPETLEVEQDDAEKNKIFGVIAYVPFLFFVPLIVAKDSAFGKYHANQGLVLFITMVGSLTVLSIGEFLPLGIGYIFGLLHLVAYLGLVVLVILGIINAASGKCVPLPLIGGIKLLK